MEKYIIISQHTAEDCRAAVKHFREHHAGYLSHYLWGCYDNDHTAYLITDAGSHDEALLSVPPLFRPKAKAIKLTSFDPKKPGDKAHQQQG
jgi:hypothetical protein